MRNDSTPLESPPPPATAARPGAVWLPPPEGRTSTNPYPELLYDALAGHGVPREQLSALTFGELWKRRRAVRFLHFNWRPDRCYAPSLGLARRVSARRAARAGLELARFALLLRWAQLLSYRVVWTVHEIRPPRDRGAAARIDIAGVRLLTRASRLLIAHDRAIAQRLQSELGTTLPIEIVPHGTFAGAYPPVPESGGLRASLGIPPDAFVFLCFGQIRTDKALGLLLEAFAGLQAPDAHLLIAGVPIDRAAARRARRAAARDGRIRLLLEQIADEQVSQLFAIADAFVLPRSEVWTSGSLVLALSMGLPAIAARTESNEELLVGDRPAGWLFMPGDVASLGRALSLACTDRTSLAARREAARVRGAQLPTWDEVAGRIAVLFAALDTQAEPAAGRVHATRPTAETILSELA